MMDCSEAIATMAPYLDRALSEAEIEEVRAHLSHCGCCGDAFRFEESILKFVRSGLKEEALPEGFEQRLQDLIRNCGD